MKTQFAKAIEAGEDVVGKELVCVLGHTFNNKIYSVGDVFKVTYVNLVPSYHSAKYVAIDGQQYDPFNAVYFFEFKHVLEKQKETNEVQFFDPFKNQCLAKFLAEADEENKRLKEQLDGAIEINKQYEQQLKQCRDDLFNLRMENARLELAALRWQMFDCEANRNIADKLLKRLADEAV